MTRDSLKEKAAKKGFFKKFQKGFIANSRKTLLAGVSEAERQDKENDSES
jgi:hypothetical protein